MEGKEVRFGIPASALFGTVTTDASCGAVNAMHDSYTPLGGLVPLANILTGEVKRNGIGGIDPARFDRSVEQMAEDFKFQKRPSATDIFDDSFLPPLGGRLIN